MIGLVTLAVAGAIIPLVIIGATGILVARVTDEVQLGAVVVPFAVLAGCLALQQVLSPVQGALNYRTTSRIDGSLRVRAMGAAARPVGIELLEDEAIQDRMEVAAGKPSVFRSATPGGAAVAVVGLAARFAQAGGSALLVARFSPLLALALLAGTVALRRANHRANVARPWPSTTTSPPTVEPAISRVWRSNRWRPRRPGCSAWPTGSWTATTRPGTR